MRTHSANTVVNTVGSENKSLEEKENASGEEHNTGKWLWVVGFGVSLEKVV